MSRSSSTALSSLSIASRTGNWAFPGTFFTRFFSQARFTCHTHRKILHFCLPLHMRGGITT